MSDLFEVSSEQERKKDEPLAARMRPATLDEVIGQKHIIGKDKLLYRAIKADQISSIIFYGPPGTGKTTLAKVIANSTSADFEQVNATIAGKKDLELIVEKAKENFAQYSKKTILFIDEIHRLNKVVEEILYPAMEDFCVDVVIGKEASTRSVRIDLPPFTLVGATTRAGDLSAPLRDRFGIVSKLEYYSEEELTQIIDRTSRVYNIVMDDDAKRELARRSRGTPRIANRLFRRVRDFSQFYGDATITRDRTIEALERLKVDNLGLDDVDHKYLLGIIHRFKGGPVGLEAIAASIGEEPQTLEDVNEPYLLQIGLIKRTPRGRIATAEAYRHLNIEQDYE